MAVQFQDYYATLGVPKGADDATIKKAYRKLARENHPDVSKAPGAETKFKAISEAYEVLSDPAKRKRYDALGPDWKAGQGFNSPPPGGGQQFRNFYSKGGKGQQGSPFENFEGFRGMGGGESGFSDFFESLFGGAGFGGGPGGARSSSRRRPGPSKGQDHESELTISLEDACSGAVRSITMSAQNPDGSVAKNSFDVKLPRGTPDGARIRLAGKGGPAAPGGTPGDLFLRIHIAPHPIFKLSGRDLEESLDITPWEAVLGAEVEVKTLDSSARIRLKPGTQSGQKIRLKGKGMPGQKGEAEGDLYAVVRIVVPHTPTPVEEDLFKQLAQRSTFKPRP